VRTLDRGAPRLRSAGRPPPGRPAPPSRPLPVPRHAARPHPRGDVAPRSARPPPSRIARIRDAWCGVCPRRITHGHALVRHNQPRQRLSDAAGPSPLVCLVILIDRTRGAASIELAGRRVRARRRSSPVVSSSSSRGDNPRVGERPRADGYGTIAGLSHPCTAYRWAGRVWPGARLEAATASGAALPALRPSAPMGVGTRVRLRAPCPGAANQAAAWPRRVPASRCRPRRRGAPRPGQPAPRRRSERARARRRDR